jgi:HEPN domain-containing protein
MTQEEKDYIQKLLTKAEHDLQAAENLIHSKPQVLDAACFHCQQCAEKYLKAYLFSKGIDFEKIHDIKKLQSDCAKIDKDFLDLNFENLDIYAVEARYADNFLLPELSEAEKYFEIARQIKELVLGKLNH